MKTLTWSISDPGIHYSKNSRPMYLVTRRGPEKGGKHATWDVARGEGNIIATAPTCQRAKKLAEDDYAQRTESTSL
jgi:hypothetical protein